MSHVGLISLILIVQNNHFESIWQYKETFMKMLSEKRHAITVDLGTGTRSSKIY